MAAILFHTSSKLFFLLSLLCFPRNAFLDSRRLSHGLPLQADVNVTVGIGIGIGIGIGNGGPPSVPEPAPEPEPICSPASPPPSENLTPGDFPNLLLYQSYVVIQRFKRTIYSDPNNITKTWNGPDLAKYRGFFLGTPPRYTNITPAVASVDFNGFRLGAPTLAGFIDRLTDLALFHANSNEFAGTLPDLTQLPYLYELDLSNNKFAGEFPSAILPLTKLNFLDLRYNGFAGTVPNSVFLIRLDVLFLNNNLFAQPLPPDIGRTGVAFLTLANNGFTGVIPASIADTAGTLTEVLFLGNRLSGCLPAEIGRLQKATVFDAGFNEITGPIPPALGCMVRVEQLNFASNLLYGEVPGEVCRLGNGGRLLNLSLSDNYFTSLGSCCLNLIERGILDVRKNCIPNFPEQRTPEECAQFLTSRKYCPALKSAPCYTARGSGGNERNSSSGGGSPAKRRRYGSYTALLKKNGL